MIRPNRKHSHISLEKVITVSFLMNISDVVVNIIIAFITGSVTMYSQALEGAADLLSSGFLLIGAKQAERPPDSQHPFGHGRELYFWSFLAGLITFAITATFSFYLGLQRFLHPDPIEHLLFTYLALTLSVITNGYALSLSYKRLVGNKKVTQFWHIFTHSALIETKTTFVLDLMGTSAALLGLLALIVYRLSGDLRFDGIGAMAIGVTLSFFAIFILHGAKELLVGQSAPADIVQKITKTVESFKEIKEVIDLRTVIIGSEKLLVNVEIHVIDNLTTDTIEQLIDAIETKIREEVPSAIHIQIELEPPDRLANKTEDEE